MKKILTIIFLILIGAAISKPSANSFDSYIEKEVQSKSNNSFLSKLTASATSTLNKYTKDYDDKIFYSTASTKISGRKITYLGIFGFWFKTN